MLVTKLESIGQKKIKVYMEEEYAFLLYTTDVHKYNLIEGEEIAESVYEEIMEDTVYRRAKQKALALLKFMDRTEEELRNKLIQAYYTKDIVDRTIDYVYSYHYLDDERYAVNYIQAKQADKSKKQIQMELIYKGIDKNIVEASFQKASGTDEAAILKAIRKKTNHTENLTIQQKQKLSASLYRKGFLYEDIRRYLS